MSMFALVGTPPALASTSGSTRSPARATGAGKPAPSHRENATQSKKEATTTANPDAPVPVAASDIPPIGRQLSSNRVLEIAEALAKMRAVRARYPGSYGGAYLKGPGRWQVSFFSKRNQEIGQAIIADRDGRVLEQWTGFQIAWSMARGYPGAFGRHVNALYIWIPLCVLFFLAFFDWRAPLRLLHLDLLVLLSFSVSLAFFNHARIGLSTPLAYPPLAYLLVRMLLLARVGRRRPPARPSAIAAGPPRPPEDGLGRPDGFGASPAHTPPHPRRCRVRPVRPSGCSCRRRGSPSAWSS